MYRYILYVLYRELRTGCRKQTLSRTVLPYSSLNQISGNASGASSIEVSCVKVVQTAGNVNELTMNSATKETLSVAIRKMADNHYNRKENPPQKCRSLVACSTNASELKACVSRCVNARVHEAARNRVTGPQTDILRSLKIPLLRCLVIVAERVELVILLQEIQHLEEGVLR